MGGANTGWTPHLPNKAVPPAPNSHWLNSSSFCRLLSKRALGKGPAIAAFVFLPQVCWIVAGCLQGRVEGDQLGQTAGILPQNWTLGRSIRIEKEVSSRNDVSAWTTNSSKLKKNRKKKKRRREGTLPSELSPEEEQFHCFYLLDSS